ncbi:DUF2958 domain-containing protein [Dethiothermospora halolimnae]|uniref:DUF2958 domain-containing protein n=1 Tax=Dethiothermospora halolimnae TaxID=3114390 RepID=UPI003CCC14FF
MAKELFNKELKERLEVPNLYETDGKEEKETIVKVRFYDLCSSWEWYLIEADIKEEGVICFGWVVGFEKELGYFSINELEDINKKFPRIIRDEEFELISLADLKKKYKEPYRPYPKL